MIVEGIRGLLEKGYNIVGTAADVRALVTETPIYSALALLVFEVGMPFQSRVFRCARILGRHGLYSAYVPMDCNRIVYLLRYAACELRVCF